MKNTATGPTYETAAAGATNGRNLMRLPDHVRPPEALTPEQAKARFYRLAQMDELEKGIAEQQRLLADLLR